MPSETPFPHLTSTSSPPTYHIVAETYRQLFNAHVASGTLRPLVLPYHLYGGFALILYLCIPHTRYPWVYKARWLALGVITWFQWQTLRTTSSSSPATALAAGLTAAWGVVWCVVWLALMRPQWDAKRVQRMQSLNGEYCGRGIQHNGGTPDGVQGSRAEDGCAEIDTISHKGPNGTLRNRTVQNGDIKSERMNGNLQHHAGTSESEGTSQTDAKDTLPGFYWQSYPENFTERVHWVMDLIMNFRGPGWNWAIPPLPDIPDFVKQGLGEYDGKPSGKISSAGLRQYTTRQELFNGQIPPFVVGYFILDIVKTTMMKDPYYIFGPTTYALPTHLAILSSIQLRIYRELLSAIAVVVSLQMAFSLIPISMGLIFGPRVFGQRAEPWYFPSSWGSFSNITEKGLNGLWGGWWHQTFRFAFSAPSNYLINNGHVEARSMPAKLLALFFAFGISGFIHTGGSISQVPKTCPWHAPIFFMLQGLGIFIQTTIYGTLKEPIDKLPKIIRQVGNLVFTFVWLLSTGWILVDDFSRGGIWLYEPIPFSPLRGLGFGVEGDGWWCWKHIGVGWYTGKHWWESGIAL